VVHLSDLEAVHPLQGLLQLLQGTHQESSGRDPKYAPFRLGRLDVLISSSAAFGPNCHFLFSVAVNLVPMILQGLYEPIDVGAVGANQQSFAKSHLARILAEVEGNWQLNAPRRGLPPTAQNGEATDREIEYHPPWPFEGAPSQKVDSEPAGPSVSG